MIALKDSKGAGVADSVQRFGPTRESGAHGGTGIALFEGYLYAEIDDRIVRYTLPPGGRVPQGRPRSSSRNCRWAAITRCIPS